MRRFTHHNSLIFFLGLALASGAVVSQPISPTSDVKSTNAATPVAIPLDLPYKPTETLVEVPTNPDGTPVDPNANAISETATATSAATSAATKVEPEKKYSFANIPYLALKYPAVKALPDPE